MTAHGIATRGTLDGLSESEILSIAEVKFGLLAQGARVDPALDAHLHDAKQPIRTRSGISGGLDISLSHGVDVNVPVRERFAATSPYALRLEGDACVVTRDDEVLRAFRPHPTPEYYEKQTFEGEPMHRIGQMCSADRFCYGMTGPTCFFWARSRRCQYCTIGKNYSADMVRKQERQMMEVLRCALSDPKLRATHVLLGGGTPPVDDMGASMAADLCRSIKAEHPTTSVYVMIAAPLHDDAIHALHDAGVDEIGLNLEFWTEQAWRKYIPGKDKVIGRSRYLAALETCVALWGPIATRSILIAGLEPLDATFEGARQLAHMGVMPIVSPFRPLEDAVLADVRGPSMPEYLDLWQRIDAEVRPLGMPLGPACIACQNNTLALPTDGRYY
jgi:Radical SAM superfamily